MSHHQLNMFKKSDPRLGSRRSSSAFDLLRVARSKETFGLNLHRLRKWKQVMIDKQLSTELAKQQIAVAKVRTFLDAITMVVKIQSWWRMVKVRQFFYEYQWHRLQTKYDYFRAWKLYRKSEEMRQFNMFGKFFNAWKNESLDQRRLKQLIATFFTMCIQRGRLSPQAVMAYFNVSLHPVTSLKPHLNALLLLTSLASGAWRSQRATTTRSGACCC